MGNTGNLTITFSGKAICRCPHFILALGGQDSPVAMVLVSFTGSTYAYRTDIHSVKINDTSSGYISTSNTVLSVAKYIGSGWGSYILFNLIPTDPVEYTVNT